MQAYTINLIFGDFATQFYRIDDPNLLKEKKIQLLKSKQTILRVSVILFFIIT